jgi:class 3 adenylate cyclase
VTLKDELTTYTRDTFRKAWDVKDWDRVPTADDKLGLGNVGVKINATVLYADLADSTGLVKSRPSQFAAEVYKTYIYAAAKAIRYHGGQVTAYDGDRVMGVFMGGQMRNDAVDAACHISGIVEDIVQPELDSMYGAGSYTVNQKIGIDRSELLVANTGIRGNNDYVWVGTAANNAAKLAALKRGYTTYITHDVFSVLTPANLKVASTGANLWTDLGTTDLGYRIYGSFARKVHI